MWDCFVDNSWSASIHMQMISINRQQFLVQTTQKVQKGLKNEGRIDIVYLYQVIKLMRFQTWSFRNILTAVKWEINWTFGRLRLTIFCWKFHDSEIFTCWLEMFGFRFGFHRGCSLFWNSTFYNSLGLRTLPVFLFIIWEEVSERHSYKISINFQ